MSKDNTINESLQDYIDNKPNLSNMTELERMQYGKEQREYMDAIKAEVENNKYYKMVIQAHEYLSCIKNHIYIFASPSIRACNLSPEYEALYNNAKDSVIMAIHNIKAADMALMQALRIQAQYDFVRQKPKVIDTSKGTFTEL